MALGDTLGLSPSLCVLPPFGATRSHSGPLSWCWVTLWSCHHPLCPVPIFGGATKSHRGPQCNLGGTLGLSPSLCVPSPSGATTSHRGSPMQFECHFWVVTIPLCPVPIWCHQIPCWSPVMALGDTWCCHHPSVSCPHLVPPNPTGVPNAIWVTPWGFVTIPLCPAPF